jgi:hypothetical protein
MLQKNCKNLIKIILLFSSLITNDHIDQRQQQQINGTNHVQHDTLTPVQEFCVFTQTLNKFFVIQGQVKKTGASTSVGNRLKFSNRSSVGIG